MKRKRKIIAIKQELEIKFRALIEKYKEYSQLKSTKKEGNAKTT